VRAPRQRLLEAVHQVPEALLAAEHEGGHAVLELLVQVEPVILRQPPPASQESSREPRKERCLEEVGP